MQCYLRLQLVFDPAAPFIESLSNGLFRRLIMRNLTWLLVTRQSIHARCHSLSRLALDAFRKCRNLAIVGVPFRNLPGSDEFWFFGQGVLTEIDYTMDVSVRFLYHDQRTKITYLSWLWLAMHPSTMFDTRANLDGE